MISNAKNKELLYYTIGFNSIVKNVANKIGASVTTVLPFIFKDINEKINTETEDFEYINELVDYYLSIIDYFVRMCPNETKSSLKSIIDVVYKLISYDPNSAVDDDAEEIDIEEEEDEYEEWDDMYDNGDTAWKVRRAAVQVADTLIQTHPELLRELAETVFDKLVKRFKEKEQNVKLDVFNALSDFLRMIVYGDTRTEEDNIEELIEMPKLTRMKSAFIDYSHKISNMIASLTKVFKDKKATPALKVAASNLLFKASKCTPDAVIEKIDVVFPLIETHFSQSNNPSELKVNMIRILRSLLKSQVDKQSTKLEAYFNKIIKIIESAIKNDYFKISAEGFKALSVFYRVLRPNVSASPDKFSTYVKPILPLIVDKLKETDIDQEVIGYIKYSYPFRLNQLLLSMLLLSSPSLLMP